MDKTEFLTIYATFENLSAVKKTLPTVIDETRLNDAKLIVHDSSVKGREEKWRWLLELNENDDFFLILSSNLSMAHARNMCFHLGQELYAPDYICMVEDDHGFRERLIESIISAMKQYYGTISPNGLRYGLFTGCGTHHNSTRGILDDGNAFPTKENGPGIIGSSNSCFRCAPTAHWNNVLKGYDTDEYLISTFQTKHINDRNYHKGFTAMIIQNGKYCFDLETEGRGTSAPTEQKLWDEMYTASDYRSKYLGKKESDYQEDKGREDSIKKVIHHNTLSNKIKKRVKKILQ